MKFLDQAKVYIRSGDGGAGAVSFRREKFIEFGGPDGGDGGRGGDVIAECVDGLNTLIDYRYQQHFKAKTGGHGMGKNRAGAAASDVVLKVPVGTQVFDEDNLRPLKGHLAIGHNRYSTTGSSHIRNSQPYLIETLHGPLGLGVKVIHVPAVDNHLGPRSNDELSVRS